MKHINDYERCFVCRIKNNDCLNKIEICSPENLVHCKTNQKIAVAMELELHSKISSKRARIVWLFLIKSKFYIAHLSTKAFITKDMRPLTLK